MSKNDMLDSLLYASAAKAGKNETEEYKNADPELTLSPSSQKKIRKRLEREKKYIAHHESYRPAHEMMKRAAAVVLVVMAVGFAGVISVEAVRLTLWESVVEWYEDNIRILYVKDDSAKCVNEIRDYKEPHPEGDYNKYELSKNGYRYSLEYEIGSASVSYRQYLLSNHAGKMSDNHTVLKQITVNGNDGYITEYEENGVTFTMLTWNDGVYVYLLSGVLSADELASLAETVH